MITVDEAIGYIKGKLDCMKKCSTFDCLNSDECDECDYCYAQGTFREQKEAFEIAIQALEKLSGYSKKDIVLNRNAMYNKGIDDFIKLAKEYEFKYGNKDITYCVITFIEFLSEQLKENDVK